MGFWRGKMVAVLMRTSSDLARHAATTGPATTGKGNLGHGLANIVMMGLVAITGVVSREAIRRAVLAKRPERTEA